MDVIHYQSEFEEHVTIGPGTCGYGCYRYIALIGPLGGTDYSDWQVDGIRIEVDVKQGNGPSVSQYVDLPKAHRLYQAIDQHIREGAGVSEAISEEWSEFFPQRRVSSGYSAPYARF